MSSLLIEIDDDSHPFSYAFLLWAALVGCLWYYSRKVEQRDRQRIDAAARGQVEQVRERVQRERSDSDRHRAPSAAPASSIDGAPSSPRVPGSPQPSAPAAEREDCPICLSVVSWPVDTPCDHTFCCQCFITYHEQVGGVMPEMVTCPICRRKCDSILPSEPGWTPEEINSPQGRLNQEAVDQYNRRYSSEPRSWTDQIREAPHYLKRFYRELTSGGESSMRLLRQVRFWLLVGSSLLYFLSPVDIIPEALFGLIGLLDDVFLLIVVGVMVASIIRNISLQQQQQQPAEPVRGGR